MSLADRLAHIAEQLENLRPQIRPEGDQARALLAASIDAASADLAAMEPAPPPAEPAPDLAGALAAIEQRLAAIEGAVIAAPIAPAPGEPQP